MHKSGLICRAVLLAGFGLLGTSVVFAAPAPRQGAGHGSANYANCMAQKKAAARMYCQNAGKSCASEIAAARSECRREVRLGLHFQSN